MAAALDTFCPHLLKNLAFFFRLCLSQAIANHKKNQPGLFYNHFKRKKKWKKHLIFAVSENCGSKFIAPLNVLFIGVILACYSLLHHCEDP